MLDIQDSVLFERIEQQFRCISRDLVFVHSDVMNGFAIQRPNPFDRTAFLKTHFQALQALFSPADLWFPVFNYSFPKSGFFDQRTTPSAVGHLSEYVRTEVANWRTPVPVFSVSGTGEQPVFSAERTTDAYGTDSIFGQLVRRDGLIFFYGCDLKVFTFIHHCESIARCSYRYPKVFTGLMRDATGNEKEIAVQFHVRPRGSVLEYDWQRLQTDLLEQGILWSVGIEDRDFYIASARGVLEYWKDRLEEDPLFLLDRETKAWVEPALDELGRAFVLSDFELEDSV